MTLSIPNLGEIRLLKLILGNTKPTSLILHLYSNNIYLGNKSFTTNDFLKGDQISDDLKVGNGYSPIALNGDNWTVRTSGGYTVAEYNSPVTFTFTNNAVKKIYGYFITASSDPEFEYSDWIDVDHLDDIVGAPLWAESFDNGAFIVPSVGGKITINPKIRLGSAVSLVMTATPTRTLTSTPTLTPTISLTQSLTNTPTSTPTLTSTSTSTPTPSPTVNFSNVVEIITTPTPTLTSTPTPSPTVNFSDAVEIITTSTPTPTLTPTTTPSPTVNFSDAVEIVTTPTPTLTPTTTPSPTVNFSDAVEIITTPTPTN